MSSNVLDDNIIAKEHENLHNAFDLFFSDLDKNYDTKFLTEETKRYYFKPHDKKN